jgi:hypothetical protein
MSAHPQKKVRIVVLGAVLAVAAAVAVWFGIRPTHRLDTTTQVFPNAMEDPGLRKKLQDPALQKRLNQPFDDAVRQAVEFANKQQDSAPSAKK